jgi:pimeloyl-ACP methyl ester carboxylesterase
MICPVTTYVLVHGGWTGGYAFRHVRRSLQARGHEVFTPSLTGIGERSHLTSPQVDLTTHVQDVVNLILYEDLDRIVLLGFSYGGAVVTGALEHISNRVEHLVYLDAFVPDDGQSVLSMAGAPARAARLEDDWLVPPAPRDFDDPDEAAFVNARRTPHPIGCFTEPVRLLQPLESFPFSRTYIRARADRPDAPGANVLSACAERARGSAHWQYHEIETNHMVASNRPEELADLLLELAT